MYFYEYMIMILTSLNMYPRIEHSVTFGQDLISCISIEYVIWAIGRNKSFCFCFIGVKNFYLKLFLYDD